MFTGTTGRNDALCTTHFGRRGTEMAEADTGPGASKGKRRLGWALAFVVVLAAAGVLISLFWVAPTPAIFDREVTLEQAMTAAAADDRVVLAVVTADYCIQCQMYKRGALADQRVADWVSDNAQTVYVKWGEPGASQVGAESFPATALLKDGDVIAVHHGVMSAEQLLEFLRGNASGAGAG